MANATIPRWVYDSCMSRQAYPLTLDADIVLIYCWDATWRMSKELYDSLISNSIYNRRLSVDYAQVEYECYDCDDPMEIRERILELEKMRKEAEEIEDYEKAAMLRDKIGDLKI